MKRILAFLALVALIGGVSVPLGAQANPKRAPEIKEAARLEAQQKKIDRADRLTDIKSKVAARKLVMQVERCEARSAKLAEKMPKLANSATVIKGVIDKKYDKVQEFYTSGQLTVDNYEEHIEAIELAKANAETSLMAVDEFEFTLDCENKKVGEQLDSFRTAIKDARNSLKDYRKVLVALISDMRSEAAKDKDDSDDTGSESGETEPETSTEVEAKPETEVENETEVGNE